MMTEATSSSAQCSPPAGGETKTEDKDPFKPMGSLTFLIDNFREFTKRPPVEISKPNPHSFAKVSVRGLTFRLAAYPTRCVSKEDLTKAWMAMGIILKCENASGCDEEGDGSWSCLASVTLQIKSLFEPVENDFLKFSHKFFSNKEESSLEWIHNKPWSFAELLDPDYGLYNEKDDTFELIAEISVDAPAGIMELPKTDIIQVNKETVVINKNQLALYSRYFHTMFYNEQYPEGQSGVYKVEIEEPATVGHFKRMLQTMYPENRPLDDECIEGILHVANQFLVTVIEGKCLKFLTEKSKAPALFKYRVADKYGCTALKKHVLDNLKVADFKGEMFKVNMAEYVHLAPDAAEAFMVRYDELFPPKTDE